MSPKLDISAIKRGADYLKAIGFSRTEAQSAALAAWDGLGPEASLADFMETIHRQAAGHLPIAHNRPLKLGHMPTADFE